MEILIPKETGKHWQELLGQVTQAKPMKPFEPLSLAFMQEVSNSITSNKELISYIEASALAHWLCERHLKEIYQYYESKRQGKIWLPRGVVLHFPSSNVDSVCIYSWFLSLLVGNINIIRLSQMRSAQIKLLLDMLNLILNQERFKAIRERSMVVSYGHEEVITKELSKACHVRVIWGGDETIRQIRAIPLPPRATELVFADRFSMAAFKADAVLNASEEELDALSKKFFTDAFMLNQNTCASPRLIFWIGEQEHIDKAKNRFWPAFKKIVSQREINWAETVGIERMITGYRYVASGLADKLSTAGTDLPYRIHVQKFEKNLRELHSGGGIFLETEKPTLMEVLELITFKDQTLVVYGFSTNELEEFAWQLGGRGIDRIVGIGQALNLFDVIWDGYDMLTYLTREVTVI